MAKAKLAVNPKTRAVERVAELPPPSPIDLPKPEPIKLWKAGDQPANGNGAVAASPPPVAGLRLDLACGQRARDGYEGVDLYAPNAQHKVDLWKFPWPWADGSVEAINCTHFIEHIPAREVESGDLVKGADAKRWLGQDMLFAFFDEAWRILKPDGQMNIVCPSVRSERAFQDPTHRRFIAQATFFYLSKVWREMNKLDHYNVRCNFSGDVNFSFPVELQGRHQEVQNDLFARAWNVILDWMVVLKAVK